ncbi:MAG: hypothetical protein ACXVLM_18495 [Ilumatobacteraceae bacterium]
MSRFSAETHWFLLRTPQRRCRADWPHERLLVECIHGDWDYGTARAVRASLVASSACVSYFGCPPGGNGTAIRQVLSVADCAEASTALLLRGAISHPWIADLATGSPAMLGMVTADDAAVLHTALHKAISLSSDRSVVSQMMLPLEVELKPDMAMMYEELLGVVGFYAAILARVQQPGQFALVVNR